MEGARCAVEWEREYIPPQRGTAGATLLLYPITIKGGGARSLQNGATLPYEVSAPTMSATYTDMLTFTAAIFDKVSA